MFLTNQIWSHDDDIETAPACDVRYPAPSPGVAKPEQSSLTALEQSVVALSLFDRSSSLGRPCAFVRFLTWAVGGYSPNRLADDRLEALRRYCILIRETHGVAPDEHDNARAAGFSEGALNEASRLVLMGRRR